MDEESLTRFKIGFNLPTLLVASTVVMTLLKLAGVSFLSWWFVMAPLLVLAGALLMALMVVGYIVVRIEKDTEDE